MHDSDDTDEEFGKFCVLLQHNLLNLVGHEDSDVSNEDGSEEESSDNEEEDEEQSESLSNGDTQLNDFKPSTAAGKLVAN